MPKRDHLDKQGKHMGGLPPMEKHPGVDVEAGDDSVAVWLEDDDHEGLMTLARFSDPQLRWLINELGSAWSRVYGEQK
jgi:hypothetical protein